MPADDGILRAEDPVTRLKGLGPAAAGRLQGSGIRTLAELAAARSYGPEGGVFASSLPRT